MTIDPAGAWLKTSPKMRGPLARLSWDAELVWWKLYLYCAEVGNDGVVPLSELHVAMDRKIPAAKVRKIVAELHPDFVTLHDDRVELDWRNQPRAEEWKDPILRERWLRRKRLTNDGELCRRIRDRDRNLCRYCGVRVDWKIKKDTKNHGEGGTYDHVDPDGDNSLENVVVACRRCNGRKKDRTPEQWVAAGGRTLKRPGTTSAQAEGLDGLDPGQTVSNPMPEAPLRARARPDQARPCPDRVQTDHPLSPLQPVTSNGSHPHEHGGT